MTVEPFNMPVTMIRLLSAEGVARVGRPFLVVARSALTKGTETPTPENVRALAEAILAVLPILYPPDEQREWEAHIGAEKFREHAEREAKSARQAGTQAAMIDALFDAEREQAAAPESWARFAADRCAKWEASVARMEAEIATGTAEPKPGTIGPVKALEMMRRDLAQWSDPVWLEAARLRALTREKSDHAAKTAEMFQGFAEHSERTRSAVVYAEAVYSRPDGWDQERDGDALDTTLAPPFRPVPDGSMMTIDARLVGLLRTLGDADAAEKIETRAKERWSKAENVTEPWRILTAGGRPLLVADNISDAGEVEGEPGQWEAPRWGRLAAALWPSVKAELAKASRVAVVNDTFLARLSGFATHGKEPAGLVVDVPTLTGAVLNIAAERYGDVARSVASGALLRAVATHAARSPGEELVFDGGWNGAREALGMRSRNDNDAVREAAELWDATRFDAPEIGLNVRVLTYESGLDAATGRRSVVIFRAGQALTWHTIRGPHDFAEWRPVPVPEHRPPPALGTNQRGAELWLQLELLRYLAEQSREYASQGGVIVPREEWLRMFDRVRLPVRSRGKGDNVQKVIEGWQGGGEQGDLLPFLVVEGDKVTIAPNHDAVDRFLRNGGVRREKAAKGGAKKRGRKSSG